MKNVNLIYLLDMNGELVKIGIIEKIELRKFGVFQKMCGIIKNWIDGVFVVLNSNLRKYCVKYGKFQFVSIVLMIEKGSCIDNQYKCLFELFILFEKKLDGILNGGDKISFIQEE